MARSWFSSDGDISASWTIENKEVSSTKNFIQDLIPSSRSFTKIEKSKGPRTEPRGTPD